MLHHNQHRKCAHEVGYTGITPDRLYGRYGMISSGMRRVKAAYFRWLRAHQATAPGGSNRSSGEAGEVAEVSGVGGRIEWLGDCVRQLRWW